MNLFEESIESIKSEAETNSNKLGWRFLLTSKKTLEKNNSILLIGLNPGGSVNRTDHVQESCEDGCAYLVESWKGKPSGTAPLQKQIEKLFAEIANRMNITDYKEILDASVCGYFIPFRSPRFDDLKEKDRCINFSKNLWSKILSNLRFRLIFCIGKNDTYENVKDVLLSMQYFEAQLTEEPTKWSNTTALISRFKKGDEKVTLVGLPHLSTFKIFSSLKSKEAIGKIMNKALQDFK